MASTTSRSSMSTSCTPIGLNHLLERVSALDTDQMGELDEALQFALGLLG